MTPLILSSLFFGLAVACYAISQKQQHGQLRWTRKDKPLGFWGEDSDLRKYKDFGLSKEPRFFGATTFAVALTDGYHLMQFFMFGLLVLSIITFKQIWPLWIHFLVLYGIRHVVFWLLYERILNKRK